MISRSARLRVVILTCALLMTGEVLSAAVPSDAVLRLGVLRTTKLRASVLRDAVPRITVLLLTASLVHVAVGAFPLMDDMLSIISLFKGKLGANIKFAMLLLDILCGIALPLGILLLIIKLIHSCYAVVQN